MNKYPRTFVAPPEYDFKNPNMDEKSCHIWLKHEKNHHDNDLDGGWSCMFCQGGLSACTVCGGLEGALTTQCPGRKLTEDEIDRVYGFLLDFNHNRWWTPKEVDDGPVADGSRDLHRDQPEGGGQLQA